MASSKLLQTIQDISNKQKAQGEELRKVKRSYKKLNNYLNENLSQKPLTPGQYIPMQRSISDRRQPVASVSEFYASQPDSLAATSKQWNRTGVPTKLDFNHDKEVTRKGRRVLSTLQKSSTVQELPRKLTRNHEKSLKSQGVLKMQSGKKQQKTNTSNSRSQSALKRSLIF